MNLRTIGSNIFQWFLPTDPTKTTHRIANRLYRNRILTQRNGDADGDWNKAERIRKNEVRRLLFWANQPCLWAEKNVIEPVANCVDRADLFRIISRLSPTIEALGVIAIPLVLFFATQRYQENLQQRELEKLQQATVTNYLNQLSTILLDVKGDLRDLQNEELRTLTTVTTLTLLTDPNLDGERRSQVMRFLRQMGLVNRERVYGPKQPDDMVIALNFSGADLEEADLSATNLSGVSLTRANLSKANLSGAHLYDTNLSSAYMSQVQMSDAHLVDADLRNAVLQLADLRNARLGTDFLIEGVWYEQGANLSSADLLGANLVDANLSYVNFRDANLESTDLRGANLKGANLEGANLWRADLRGANLERVDLWRADLRNATLKDSGLGETYICETQLPETIEADPNRDCETLKQRYPWRFESP